MRRTRGAHDADRPALRRWVSPARRPAAVLAVLALLAATLTPAAAAEERKAIGRLKEVAGTATIVSGEQTRPARPGEPIYLLDVVETAGDGSLGIVFTDESRLSIGPDTRLTVDEYVYAPARGEASFVTRIVRGTLLYVSGLIAKVAPGSSRVDTPVGTLGIRGTRFLVKLVEE